MAALDVRRDRGAIDKRYDLERLNLQTEMDVRFPKQSNPNPTVEENNAASLLIAGKKNHAEIGYRV